MKDKARLVKICGITSVRDAQKCADLGADMIGFIFHPQSPRFVGPFFPETLPDRSVLKVGVFVDQDADVVRTIMDDCRLDLAQLHGGQDETFCEAVGPERVIKVLWPDRYETDEDFQVELNRFAPHCRHFLFDAGSSGGGHGRTLDRSRLRRVEVSRPWLLAGGLTPDNLPEALEQCAPHGVDLNSGVESAPGKKDHDKLEKLFHILSEER